MKCVGVKSAKNILLFALLLIQFFTAVNADDYGEISDEVYWKLEEAAGLQNNGNFDKAEEILRELNQRESSGKEKEEIYTSFINLFTIAGKFDEGITYANKLRELPGLSNDGKKLAFKAPAILYMGKEDFLASIKSWEVLFAEVPSARTSSSYGLLAVMYLRADDCVNSAKANEMGLELSIKEGEPPTKPTLQALLLCYERLGESEKLKNTKDQLDKFYGTK